MKKLSYNKSMQFKKNLNNLEAQRKFSILTSKYLEEIPRGETCLYNHFQVNNSVGEEDKAMQNSSVEGLKFYSSSKFLLTKQLHC